MEHYGFNEEGLSRGGWINNLGADRESDWGKWAALLNEAYLVRHSD